MVSCRASGLLTMSSQFLLLHTTSRKPVYLEQQTIIKYML